MSTWINIEWSNLDESAKINLDNAGLLRFYEYKNQLRKDGYKWDNDAEVILRGFIWDESENIS